MDKIDINLLHLIGYVYSHDKQETAAELSMNSHFA